jgi:putative superfamily III holin-X
MEGNGRHPRTKKSGGVGVLHRVRDEVGLFSEEVAAIRGDLQTLAARQVELLQAEAREQVGIASRMAVFGAASGIFGFLTLAFLAVTEFVALDSFMDAVWAALLTAATLALLAGIAALLARQSMNRLSFTPRRTINSLKEDSEWLGTLVKSNRR